MIIKLKVLFDLTHEYLQVSKLNLDYNIEFKLLKSYIIY